jgi:geranylgeranyl diphosphate synthase, type II
MLTALEQANKEQLQTILDWRDNTDAETAEDKVQAITAVYDGLNIRKQTEQQIDFYFQRALHHLDAVQVPIEQKATIHSLALQLMERDS